MAGEEKRASNGSDAQDEGLRGVSILTSHAERCGVLVVHLVDVLVDRRVMESTMHKEEICILNDHVGQAVEGNRAPGNVRKRGKLDAYQDGKGASHSIPIKSSMVGAKTTITGS